MHVPEDHTHPKKDVAERKRERGTAHLVRTCHAEVQLLIGPSHRRGQQAKQRSQVNGETWLYISVIGHQRLQRERRFSGLLTF